MLSLYLSLIEDQNDSSKLEEIYRLYKKKMLFVAFSVLKNQPDAEDAVHSAFVALTRNIKKLAEPQSKETMVYVCRAARNHAINIANRNKKRLLYEEPLDDDISPEQVPTPLEELCKKEDIGLISDIIRTLPSIYRDVLYLHYAEDMGTAQIAKALGIKPQTAKKRLYRAKTALSSLISSVKKKEEEL